LTLSPALAAILLRPKGAARDPLTWVLDHALGWFFRLFNAAFEVGTSAYAWIVGVMMRGSVVVLLGYGGLLGLTYYAFQKAPTGFIPQQDQGRLIVNVQLPDSASVQRTNAVMAAVEKITRETAGVAHTTTVSGISFLLSANSSNFGSMFVILDPFARRQQPHLRDEAIMARMRREFASKVGKDASVVVLGAPPIPGLSVAGGYKLMVEDRGGLGLDELQRQCDRLIAEFNRTPGLVGASTQFRSRTPQLYMDIDRAKVKALGVSLTDVDEALQVFLGSLYVNSYNQFGRYWQVTLQAEERFRARVERIDLIRVRNAQGGMVPLGSLVSVRDNVGPVMTGRYNLYSAAPITGNLRPDLSTGEAITAIGRVTEQVLPRSMQPEWTELFFMQIRAGSTTLNVFGLAIVFVFLTLAALYESWKLPLAVILVVPLCLLCSVSGVLLAGSAVNIFVQIGLVVLVGLACKNAILIVEFARQKFEEGMPVREATLEACRLRLRPILMTSFAFILGVVPLVLANGAGAEMRRSLGTAVFSGMLGVTLFGIFLTPVFFFVIESLGGTRVLSSRPARWFGSIAIGILAGSALGELLARNGSARPVWADVVGGGFGALASLLVLGLRRRWRPAKAIEGSTGDQRP